MMDNGIFPLKETSGDKKKEIRQKESGKEEGEKKLKSRF